MGYCFVKRCAGKSGELEITANGTYDVTGVARVIVKVSGAGKEIAVYMANDQDASINYALEGVKEGMTWREWIDATGGNVGSNAGWIWIEDDPDALWCGSYGEISSNGELQTPDSVMVDGATYYSNEIE